MRELYGTVGRKENPMAKRGHGEGTIILRKDGRWETKISLPD